MDLDGWQVGLDGTAASTLDFEPLDILQDLPMPVSVSVPPIVDGSPTPDEKAQVVCTVTSATDPDFSHVEILEVGVLPQAMFSVDVSVEGERLGPSALAEDVKVDSAELVELDALVSNLGNVPVDLTMTMQLGDPNGRTTQKSTVSPSSKKQASRSRCNPVHPRSSPTFSWCPRPLNKATPTPTNSKREKAPILRQQHDPTGGR